MGYLTPYLRNNPQQVVSCDDLYSLILKVEHSRNPVDLIAIAETDLTICMYIKEMVPDVEEWQYGGDINGHYIFKFHKYDDRAKARAYLISLGYTTHIRDFIK